MRFHGAEKETAEVAARIINVHLAVVQNTKTRSRCRAIMGNWSMIILNGCFAFSSVFIQSFERLLPRKQREDETSSGRTEQK